MLINDINFSSAQMSLKCLLSGHNQVNVACCKRPEEVQSARDPAEHLHILNIFETLAQLHLFALTRTFVIFFVSPLSSSHTT